MIDFFLLCCLVCSVQHCDHLLENGWPLALFVWCFLVFFFHFPLWCFWGQVRDLILSILDLCLLLYFNYLKWYNWTYLRENLTVACTQQRRRPPCANAQSDQRICYSLIRKYYNVEHFYMGNSNILASLESSAGRVEPNLVAKIIRQGFSCRGLYKMTKRIKQWTAFPFKIVISNCSKLFCMWRTWIDLQTLKIFIN